MMILSYIVGQKNYPIPYKLRKNLLYLVSSGIIAFASFVVFKRNLMVGNGLLLIYLVAVWFFEKEELKAVIDKTFQMEEIIVAHRYVDTGRKKGNVVLKISE